MPPLLLPDPAAKETDRLLAKLEQRIQREYKQALKEAEKKWTDYLAAFDAQDKLEAAKLANGEITEREYQAWRIRHIAQGKQWEEMRNVIAQDYHNRNLIASKLANSAMADVYAVNANYGTYLIEHGGKIDTGFTLYNHDSAEALLKKEWSINPETGRNSFLPPPKPGGKRALELEGLRTTNPDLLWNAKNIQSAMTQGILSGESMTKLAQRLAGVAQMDKNQAIRNARTLTTNVQSKGRMDSFDRATKLGVQLVDEWNAILDGKTRHSHRHMHGERKDHDSEEPFSNGCRWPGDPWGPPEEIYNCRCRIISWVKGFEGDTVKHNEAMGDMSFEEWQNEKSSQIKGTGDIESLYNAPRHSYSEESIRELEGYAQDKGIRLVGAQRFDGDADLLKEQIDVVAKYQEEFGVSRKIKIEISGKLAGDALGEVNEGGDVIRLLSSALRDRDITIAYLQADNYLSSSDVKGIATHEMGHVITKAKGQKGLYFTQQAIYNVYGKEVTSVQALDFLSEHVSLYASEKKDTQIGKGRRAIFEEIIPEVLAKNETNPDEFTKAFVRIVKELYGT